jgi:predicted NBD/HSP70 family sugar kinase
VGISDDDRKALKKSGINSEAHKFGELFDLASHNSAARDIVEKRLVLLGAGLTNICALLCPDTIILGGILAGIDDDIFEKVKGSFNEAALNASLICPCSYETTKIIRGTLPFKKAIFIGGALRIFNEL